MQQGVTDHRHFRMQDLRQLQHLQFTPRRAVNGRFVGRHASPLRGQSVEFKDYREYVSGDDVADIDWKVLGRSDRLYIKRFEHQSDMIVHLLVDGSASMAYKGDGENDSKYDYACRVAAAIAFMCSVQQDRFSVTFAKEGLHVYQPPGRSSVHLREALTTMEKLKPSGKAQLSHTLTQLAQRVKSNSILIVLSDLHEPMDDITSALLPLLHQNVEVLLMQVLHPDELHLPNMSEAVFVDSESGRKMRVNVEDIRGEYQQRMSAAIDRWQNLCRIRAMDYTLANTSRHYIKTLGQYLCKRSAR